MRHLLYACFVLILGMALNYFVFGVGGALSSGARFRAGGTLFAPTNAAATVALGFLLSLYQLVRVPTRRRRPGVRVVALTTLLLSIWALSVLSTRAAYISVFAALMIAPLAAHGPGITYRKLLHTTVLVLLAALVVFNLRTFETLLTREHDTENVWTMSGRIWMWQKAFEDLTPTRAVLGYGFAAMSEDIGIRDWWTMDKVLSGAHNAYLQAFLGNGIFGLIFFGLFIIEHWRTLRRRVALEHPKLLSLRFAILICFLVFGLSEHLFGLNLTPAFLLLCGAYAGLRASSLERSAAKRGRTWTFTPMPSTADSVNRALPGAPGRR